MAENNTNKTTAKKSAPAPKPKPAPVELEAPELSPEDSLSPADETPDLVAAPEPLDPIEPPKTTYHVIGNADQDEVVLSAAVYKNKYAKKSLTVHHVQRRLNEWGFTDAFADRDGYYGDLTKGAVAAFQTQQNLESTGILDAATFKRLFQGDTNVKVVLL